MIPPIVGVPAFCVVALRALLADVLAELALAQELDELRAQEDADQQRGRAGDQDRAPSALPRRRAPASAASASATRSSPTPREPLTSTVSPAPSSVRDELAAAAASRRGTA